MLSKQGRRINRCMWRIPRAATEAGYVSLNVRSLLQDEGMRELRAFLARSRNLLIATLLGVLSNAAAGVWANYLAMPIWAEVLIAIGGFIGACVVLVPLVWWLDSHSNEPEQTQLDRIEAGQSRIEDLLRERLPERER